MIDLHTHSTHSDGSDEPGRLVELAAAAGLSAIALTDHDGLSGLAEAERRGLELGVEVVRGCEVSCDFQPGTLHVLCYFVEDDTPLARRLVGLRDDRARRNAELLDRLAHLGVVLDPAEVAAEAKEAVVGRPHVAAVLVRHGYATSIPDAFARYLGKGAPGYVEREPLDAAEVVELAERSGALSVVAHPHSLGLDPPGLERAIRELAAVGLAGLEACYGGYDPATRDDLATLARRHGLVPTGGSDYHGAYKPGLALGTGHGDLAVPDAALSELLGRRPVRSV